MTKITEETVHLLQKGTAIITTRYCIVENAHFLKNMILNVKTISGSAIALQNTGNIVQIKHCRNNPRLRLAYRNEINATDN